MDPPPVERSITAAGDFTVTLPGGLVSVRMPAAAWPTPPDPQDYILVLRVDAGPAGPGFVPGTQIVEVTARWALSGLEVTEFNAPIEITFSNPAAVPAIPAWSQVGTSTAPSWTNMGRLEGTTLPPARRDGFHGNESSVSVLTHHLTFFGLKVDDGLPTPPRHIAGVVADDGLTLRWIPGTDASGELGNVLLYVNGELYRAFGPRQFETKMGPFTPGDSRVFTLVQLDAAGNRSPHGEELRAVPPVVGKSLDQAVAALAAAGFELGTVREQPVATVAPGTVVGPTAPQHAALSSKIDLVVSREFIAPQTQLVFSVACREDGDPEEADDDRRPRQGLQARHPDRDALVLWEEAALHLEGATPQARSKCREADAAEADPPARHVHADVDRPLRRGDGQPHGQGEARRQEGRAGSKRTGARSRSSSPASSIPKNVVQSALTGTRARIVAQADLDQTFALAASGAHDIKVVVVDVDSHGVGFVSDLRTVFPSIRVIAIATQPADRVRALRAGAVQALPRNTTSRQLAKAIAAISSR